MWRFDQYGRRTAAISDSGQCITYQQLAEAGDELWHCIGERCLLFSLCTNSIGSLVGYTSCLNHRVVPLLLDSHIDAGLLLNLIQTYRPRLLWVPDTVRHRIGEYLEICRFHGYCLLRTDFTEFYPLHDELALLLTTSGSTGSPKLVRQSYRNIDANAQSIVEYLALTEAERPITTLPMSYTYGLSVINSHLRVGATLLLTDRTLMEREFWEFLKGQKASSIAGVPYTYEMLDRLRFFRMDLPSLTTMTQAGGKLSPELHARFAEHALETGKRFVVMYGQTEATARMGYLPPERSLEKCGSMGIAIPGGKLYLVDAEGNEISTPGTVGELIYEGPNVTLGYAESGEDLIKGDERLGRLETGDMACMDEEGYFYIVGRKKRFLKIYGNRVNLDEVERIVKAQFASVDCACAGIDDRMSVFITDKALVNDVRKFVSEKTSLNPVAFVVRAIDQIPKSEAGKTLYAQLERYCD